MITTNVRFPTKEDEALLEAIKKSAKKNYRSMNNEILTAIDFYLRNSPEAQIEVKEVPKKTPQK